MASASPRWYKPRSYAHFDRPLSLSAATALVEDEVAVAAHAFWPLILNPIRTVRLSESGGRRIRVEKRRPIAFAAHSDAHIYAFYASKIADALEARYRAGDTGHVLAYRTFPTPKSNIHFAADAFEDMKRAGLCEVVALDVDSFFDTFDHAQLKAAWIDLLFPSTGRLPADHWAVFKACTTSKVVRLPKLRDVLGGDVRRRAGHRQATICAPADFRRLVVPHLENRGDATWDVKKKSPPGGQPPSHHMGVPQGLPISAVLANLYMLATDARIHAQVSAMGGTYRRYSDDILVIVPHGRGAEAESLVRAALLSVRLAVNPAKTERHGFVSTPSGATRSWQLSPEFTPTVLQAVPYLGLTFDGVDLRVRMTTIARFLKKATRAIRRARYAARDSGHPKIKRRKLYATLTSLEYGSAYGQLRPNGRPFSDAPRLGFFRYLKIASRVTQSSAIAKQVRQLENFIYRRINAEEEKLLREVAERRQAISLPP